ERLHPLDRNHVLGHVGVIPIMAEAWLRQVVLKQRSASDGQILGHYRVTKHLAEPNVASALLVNVDHVVRRQAFYELARPAGPVSSRNEAKPPHVIPRSMLRFTRIDVLKSGPRRPNLTLCAFDNLILVHQPVIRQVLSLAVTKD